MIRSNVPLPFLFRLRLRANFMAGRAQSRLGACQKRLWEATASTLTQPPAAQTRPDDSPAAWQEFVDRYERLTDVLCTAARLGVTSALEQEYTVLRRWFGARYQCVAHRVRPRLGEVDPASGGKCPEAGRRALDSLERILFYMSLRELLARDRGDLIPRVAGISQAIYGSPEA
jgi:hypothetical protein